MTTQVTYRFYIFAVCLAFGLGIIAGMILSDIAFGDDSQSDLGLCLEGNQRICDKLDIEKINNDMLKIAGRTECFNDINDFFTEKIKHINDTDITIMFPCPELNRSQIPQDESGK
jgi:hypothetical protein